MSAIRTTDEFEERIVANVREHGCQVNFIFDPEGQDPNFSYSIGFTETVSQPEVIVFGLQNEVMHFMINEVWRKCHDGFQLEDWAVLEGLLEGHHCVARAIPPQRIIAEYFNSAMWYHHARTGEKLAQAFQLVWPGAMDGLFPWEDGCAAEVQALQPALYAPRFDA